MKLSTFLKGGVMALAIGAAGMAQADPVKVGLITTLSGGGASLGVDSRDGFLLALKQAGDAASVDNPAASTASITMAFWGDTG